MSLAIFPKPSPRYTKGTYVYVIRESGPEQHCYHKIGLAKDIRARLAALQCANPRPLALVRFWHTPHVGYGRTVERAVLGRFADRRQIGEWLLGPVDETIAVLDGLCATARARRDAA